MPEYAKEEEFYRVVSRDSEGNMLPEDVELEDGTMIQMLPMTTADMLAIRKQNVDTGVKQRWLAELLEGRSVNPKFSADKIMSEDFMPFKYVLLVKAFLRRGGLDLEGLGRKSRG